MTERQTNKTSSSHQIKNRNLNAGSIEIYLPASGLMVEIPSQEIVGQEHQGKFIEKSEEPKRRAACLSNGKYNMVNEMFGFAMEIYKENGYKNRKCPMLEFSKAWSKKVYNRIDCLPSFDQVTRGLYLWFKSQVNNNGTGNLPDNLKNMTLSQTKIVFGHLVDSLQI